MMRNIGYFNLLVLSLVLVFAISTSAQEKDRSPRTISVTAEAKAEKDPDSVVLHIAIGTYGRTSDEAYKGNLQLSRELLNALESAGVKKEQLETSDLTLMPVQPNGIWTQAEREERQFSAHQKWDIRTSVASAQGLLDLAMKSGANESSEPTWELKDPFDLQLQALAKATIEAKRQAAVIAKGLGLSLIEVKNVSTTYPGEVYVYAGAANGRIQSYGAAVGNPSENVLRLYPNKVIQKAVLTVVYIIR